MLQYARSVACRRHFLLTYFGERSPERCGACDVCLGRHERPTITPKDEPILQSILRRIRDAVPRDEWFDEGPVPPHKLDALVNWLVEKGYVRLENPLTGHFDLTDEGRQYIE
jgi:ATP-dependent DNA helicase RecQ